MELTRPSETLMRLASTTTDPSARLRAAAEHGRLREVRSLLKAGTAITRDSNGLNALHKAARKGHSDVVKHLITTKKFKVNSGDKYGWTPLHWAAWNGHSGTVHTLVENNSCYVNSVDKTGSNAFHCAALNGHTGVVRVLAQAKCETNLQRKDGWSPLHLAAWNNHKDVVHQLIVAKANVNLSTELGSGPLHLAASKGYDDIVQELLDAGAAPDMNDKAGNTALHEAVKNGHTSTVQLLMSSDCRINVRNIDGFTPMDIASKDRNNEIVTQLSGLKNCYPNGDYNSLPELKNLLFRDNRLSNRTSGLKQKIRWSDEERAKIAEEKVRQKSVSQMKEMERIWKERVDLARSEVLAHCESRIEQVESQCKKHVAKIEKQCNQKLQKARDLLSGSESDSEDRTPSAPLPRVPSDSNYKYSILSLP